MTYSLSSIVKKREILITFVTMEVHKIGMKVTGLGETITDPNNEEKFLKEQEDMLGLITPPARENTEVDLNKVGPEELGAQVDPELINDSNIEDVLTCFDDESSGSDTDISNEIEDFEITPNQVANIGDNFDISEVIKEMERYLRQKFSNSNRRILKDTRSAVLEAYNEEQLESDFTSSIEDYDQEFTERALLELNLTWNSRFCNSESYSYHTTEEHCPENTTPVYNHPRIPKKIDRHRKNLGVKPDQGAYGVGPNVREKKLFCCLAGDTDDKHSDRNLIASR